jgi:hypothetical protein
MTNSEGQGNIFFKKADRSSENFQEISLNFKDFKQIVAKKAIKLIIRGV